MSHFSLAKPQLDFQFCFSSWLSFNNMNDCHRDTSPLTTRSHLTRYNLEDILPFTRGARTAVDGPIGPRSRSNRVEGRVMFFSVTRGIRLEMAVWGCIVAVRQWKWGRKPLSLAAHVWVRAVDPVKPQWLTAQLALRIISCVSLVCRSFSKSKALLEECRVKNLHEMKDEAGKHRRLWEEHI